MFSACSTPSREGRPAPRPAGRGRTAPPSTHPGEERRCARSEGSARRQRRRSAAPGSATDGDSLHAGRWPKLSGVAVNKTVLPSGNRKGSERSVSRFGSRAVNTRRSAVSRDRLRPPPPRRMVPSSLQNAPFGRDGVATVPSEFLPASALCAAFRWPNPIHCPSGEKNGCRAPSVPAIGWESAASKPVGTASLRARSRHGSR